MHIETDVCEPCGVLGVVRPTNKMGVNFPTHYTSKEDGKGTHQSIPSSRVVVFPCRPSCAVVEES